MADCGKTRLANQGDPSDIACYLFLEFFRGKKAVIRFDSNGYCITIPGNAYENLIDNVPMATCTIKL